MEIPRFQTSKKNVKGVTPLAIWVKTAVFKKITFVNNVNNVCSLVTLRLSVKVQTMNHHKITVMAEVKVSKEVRVAAVPAEACDVRKTSLTKTTLAGMNYVLYIFETNYLFNTSSNTKCEDVLNFSVNDAKVSLVIDAFYLPPEV